MTFRFLLALLTLICLQTLNPHRAVAQCTGGINTFPYLADFELTDENWVTGGVASDWIWGIPHKPVINSAGSGQRCWITGGLQYTVYNDNENSWLMSPCFDFTGLVNPYIRFQLFWETERKYDGASLQYSIDGGSSWTTLGSNADYLACPGSNWFNTGNITTLGSDGWSGNAQSTSPCPGGAGSGSGGWVTAGRAVPQLAGRNAVRFRFRFAAGSRCNEYDGFAIDNVWIGELQPASADFSFNCSTSRTGSFAPINIGCGDTYLWDFGDPGTGSANASTLTSPTHTFSHSGDFLVTLRVTTGGGAIATTTKTVRVLDVSANVVQPIRCNGGGTGSLEAVATPAGSYVYNWSTTPTQTTQIASGLAPGAYTLEIRGGNVCAVRVSGALSDPPPVTHTATHSDARCGAANGNAEITPAGGVGPYSFTWTVGSGSTPNNIRGDLPAGDYAVAIADAYGCPDTARFQIGNNTDLPVTLGNDTVLCKGETVMLQPRPGPYASYQWQDGSAASAYRVSQTGTYVVQVSDADGCRNTASVNVTVDCSDVSFPNAFSPDGNGRNDRFGPLGNLGALSSYTLRIYGRWGQVVFETNNPFQQWDGRVAGNNGGSQVYVWVAQYRLVRHDGMQTRKGTLLLIR
ncbi:MAG: PKD domain-containing protein [Chitinophagaceae bacterium]|nr:MAG: PKD domain-containing protein [Chitinophagaceae bacterium]